MFGKPRPKKSRRCTERHPTWGRCSRSRQHRGDHQVTCFGSVWSWS